MNLAAQRLFDEARKGTSLESNGHDSTPDTTDDTGENDGSGMTQKSAPGSDTPSAKPKTTPKRPVNKKTKKATPNTEWTIRNTDWEKSWDRSLIYPRIGRDRATVDKHDIARLDEGGYLNDNLILCYLRYLQASAEVEAPEISRRVYFMNTYFYSTLSVGLGTSINYDGVKKWTAKVDLFSYDYIVVPVNENFHWYVFIVCNPSKLLPPGIGSEQEPVPIDVDEGSQENEGVSSLPMKVDDDAPPDNQEASGKKSNSSTSSRGRRKSQRRHVQPDRKYDPQDFLVISLDSLDATHDPGCQMLRDYLLQEVKYRKKVKPQRPTSTGLAAQNIPKQGNLCDCGVYLLGYIKHFLADLDGFITTLLKQGKPTWKIDAPGLRTEIRETIFDLHRQQTLETQAENAQKKKEKKEKKSQDAGHQTTPSPPDSTNDGQKTPGLELETSAGPFTSKQNSPEHEGAISVVVQATLDPGREPSSAEAMEEDVASKHDRPFTRHKVPSPLTTCGDKLDRPPDIRPSVEDDALETPSTSGETTSTSEQDMGRARFEQEDQPYLSPVTHSPHETWSFKKLPPESEAAIRPSIEAQDGVIGDEPVFIDTIPSSSPSQRVIASPAADVKLPRKRPVKVIDVDGDEQQPPTQRQQRRRETGTRSQYFTSNDADRDPIYVPRETRSAGTVKIAVEDDRSPRAKRRRVKTIDLSD